MARGAPGPGRRVARRKQVVGYLQRVGWSSFGMEVIGALAKHNAGAKVVYGTELVPMSGLDKDVVRKKKLHG